MNRILFVFILFSALKSFAGIYGEFTGYYSTDSFTTATSSTQANTYYSLDLYANLENKYRFYGGFHVDQLNFQQTTAAGTTTLTSLDMGPMVLWVVDRKKIFTVSAGYNLVTKGNYNDGSSTYELTGTGLFATIAAMPEVAENWYVGVKINYVSLSYGKSTLGTETSDVSYSRALIFPALCVAWRD